MSAPRLLVAMFLVALFGALTGTLITLAVTDRNEDAPSERGTTVRLGADSIFWEGAEDMYCNDFHRFCVPRFEDPSDARAFYLGDTHDHFRNAGCFVDWRPDFDLSVYTGLTEAQRNAGAFRGGCSGNTYLPDGTRIFGPAPRNLDEFTVAIRRETVQSSDTTTEAVFLEVDTSTLICGEWSPTYPRDEIPEPECELAPPFD